MKSFLKKLSSSIAGDIFLFTAFPMESLYVSAESGGAKYLESMTINTTVKSLRIITK